MPKLLLRWYCCGLAGLRLLQAPSFFSSRISTTQSTDRNPRTQEDETSKRSEKDRVVENRAVARRAAKSGPFDDASSLYDVKEGTHAMPQGSTMGN